MSPTLLFVALIALTVSGYYFGRSKVIGLVAGNVRDLHSRPTYYGFYLALWCAVPAVLVAIAWLTLQPVIAENLVIAALPAEMQKLPADRLGLLINDIHNLADGNIVSRNADPAMIAAADQLNRYRSIGNSALFVTALVIAIACAAYARSKLTPRLRARNSVEQAVKVFLIACSLIAIITTIGIVLSLVFESVRFFGKVSLIEFLFGTQWSPQTALRADQVGATGAFGAIPLIVGTLLVTFIAVLVALPIGLFSAIYLADYASPRVRAIVKPLLEILAGIPTVVYGFFAALTVAPYLRELGTVLGLDVASESALAAGLVMGIMIIPVISSLSDDVINSVPQSLRDGSYALGATQSETIKKVILPAALPGIFAAFLLAVSRAIGETMIVVMAAGLAANLTANPFEAVTTVTVQIVTLLVGDQEFDSAKTLAAFALGLLLFCITLAVNIVALHVVRKYREQYD
jgi:phosphate transport system permease protein